MLIAGTPWRIGLFLIFAASASAKPLMERGSVDTTTTTAETSAPKTAASSSNTAIPSTKAALGSTSTHNGGPTSTASAFLMTETEVDGVIAKCSSTSLLLVTGASKVTTSTICLGAPVPVTTLMDEWNSWKGVVSQAALVTAPDDGCKIVDPHDGRPQYCTCGTGGKASSVSTILGFSSMNITTACATKGALPTGYVQVPPIANADSQPGGVDLVWTDPPSDKCAFGQEPTAECWGLLNMDSYVDWWGKTFKDKCGKTPFSECFWENMTPSAPNNCTGIGGDCKVPSWDQYKTEWNNVRNFYLAWTIHSMNNFFSTYYSAVGDSETTASLMIGDITKTIDPIQNVGIGTDLMMELLTVGLSFIPGPEGAIGSALMNAAKQLPGVIAFFNPMNTIDNQLEQMQDLSADFAGVVNNLQNQLGTVLPALLNNATNFAAVAKSGAFTTNNAVDENTIKNKVLQALLTVLISRSYQLNGVILSRVPDTDVVQLSTNGTKLNWPLCPGGYDENNVCDTWWFDKEKDVTYGLLHPTDFNHNFNSEMTKWFSNYTTPELLFRGADQCAQAAKSTSGSGPNLGSITSESAGLSCLSNLTVCTWSLTPISGPLYGVVNLDNFFTDCKYTQVLSKDGINSLCNPEGGQPDEYTMMERAYLGWGVIKNSTTNTDYSFCSSDGGNDF